MADADFEEILNIQEQIENVFYLEKYSIENYFVDKDGIYELIRERHPTLKDRDIDALVDLNQNLKNCKILLTDLACAFVIIQRYSHGTSYFGLNPPRDCNLTCNPPAHRNTFISTYLNEIEQELKNIDGRYTWASKKREFVKHFNTLTKALRNIPGKYLLNLLKYQLERAGLLNQLSVQTLSYKLSKECSVSQFSELQERITDYIE